MAGIFFRHPVGLDHDTDIGGVELPIDHRAVSDIGAEAEISLEQRRQCGAGAFAIDRKSTRLNSSHALISYAVFCLKKKKKTNTSLYVPYSILVT